MCCAHFIQVGCHLFVWNTLTFNMRVVQTKEQEWKRIQHNGDEHTSQHNTDGDKGKPNTHNTIRVYWIGRVQKQFFCSSVVAACCLLHLLFYLLKTISMFLKLFGLWKWNACAPCRREIAHNSVFVLLLFSPFVSLSDPIALSHSCFAFLYEANGKVFNRNVESDSNGKRKRCFKRKREER